jgi:hypothetical protein
VGALKNGLLQLWQLRQQSLFLLQFLLSSPLSVRLLRLVRQSPGLPRVLRSVLQVVLRQQPLVVVM